MKRIVGTFAIGVFSFLAFLLPVQAEEKSTFIEFVRPLGMGGAFTAVADDHNVFAFNPAGMVQRTAAEVTILEIAPGVSSDFFDAYEFISDNENDLTNFEDLSAERQAELYNEIFNNVSKLNPRFYLASDVASFVSGPKFFGLPIHGGFGALGVVDGNFDIGGIPSPNISYEVNNDILIPLSIAKRFNMPGIIPGRLGIGLTGKFIHRSQVKRDRLSFYELEDLEAPPVADGSGIGSDLGFLYQPTEKINVGVMVQDFLGTKLSFDAVPAEKGYPAQPERDSVIRPRTNVGVALFPEKLLWLLPTGNRLTLAADVRDVLNKDDHLFMEDGFRKPLGEDFWKHVHLGAEYRYWFLRFRGGAYQGYPSFGLGLDIPLIKINYAFYSREIGPRAGDLREENHIISLAFKFGTGNTEGRERIKKSKKKTSPASEMPQEDMSNQQENSTEGNNSDSDSDIDGNSMEMESSEESNTDAATPVEEIPE